MRDPECWWVDQEYYPGPRSEIWTHLEVFNTFARQVGKTADQHRRVQEQLNALPPTIPPVLPPGHTAALGLEWNESKQRFRSST